MLMGDVPNISRQHTVLIFKGQASILTDRQVGRKLLNVKHVCMSHQIDTSSFFSRFIHTNIYLKRAVIIQFYVSKYGEISSVMEVDILIFLHELVLTIILI